MLSAEKPGPEPFDSNGQYVCFDQLGLILSVATMGCCIDCVGL